MVTLKSTEARRNKMTKIDWNKVRQAEKQAKSAQERNQVESARQYNDHKNQIAEMERERLQKNHENVKKIIAGLQESVEKITKGGHTFTTLLSLSADELISEPKEYKLFNSIRVRLTPVDSINKFMRGYKPGCLPAYARELFDYCVANGFTTSLSSIRSDYVSNFNSANTPEWKQMNYKIEIYW